MYSYWTFPKLHRRCGQDEADILFAAVYLASRRALLASPGDERRLNGDRRPAPPTTTISPCWWEGMSNDFLTRIAAGSVTLHLPSTPAFRFLVPKQV